MATSLENNSHAHEKRVTSAQVIKTGSDNQFNAYIQFSNGNGGLISEGVLTLIPLHGQQKVPNHSPK